MLQAVALQDPVQDDQANFNAVVNALAGQGWCVIPDFMPPEQWQPLAAEAKQLYAAGEFRLARVGHGDAAKVRPDVRTDRVRWIDPLEATPLQQAYLERMEALRLFINGELSTGLFDFEGHFALYPKGCFYRRHLDRFADAKHRAVSCIQYLNEDWKPEDGGNLRIYLPDGKGKETYTDIQPIGGSAVIFLSDQFHHMVMPSKRERLSLTGWFCKRR
ncbi:MAG: 2OG-Fe(II) oxygenase [Zetaproteobacteria bacterium CG12_big_fil_rev_8_21_14_0_65_55_1124]|nr:MAG: hypothetical protein AUJ58_08050 [Zetaproteobacteria bacterium CG1_02_55_237]PIS19202.1 MAG: 2OG-Fe(II) oxygenase [Zetaproteobacteria bacterium CG08_land_8_20_14_0_20_55_17]PIW42937.1 MAG: 2OG-Fe(II) oxygenase [Zetaproteobacteria bacterium CG12_big_fil_rev_8_21_14_0_65_55_1124]PIY51839.1 MAG: 2OG-Fe(II) oxygenase [Zetaproteobacteria bacterium CG_4_10_14_0_8_um_filter_55_43]PIZ39899.1 MAG: 2OG-Fe(II) oxygenase [Zetaproteobacteria bacterium CG_4_10_14_0_2_um_filter_55_20]PJB79816.1 MAG: 